MGREPFGEGAGGRLGPKIDARPVLEEERAALLDLLRGLDAEDWSRPTVCPGWTVHHVAVHLVHDDLRRLSAQRDGHVGAWVAANTFDDLVTGLARTNEEWVAQVAPSLSPRLTGELLAWLAAPTAAHLRGLRPDEPGDRVAWAGPGPHPNWLDVAREYTERWVHQQQIRDAVDRPGLTEARFVEPVLDSFLRGLPAALPRRPPGSEVLVEVTGDVARVWLLRSTGDGWRFAEGGSARSEDMALAAVVRVDANALWRRAVRMLDASGVRDAAEVTGDPALATAILDLRAAIVADDADRGR